MVSRLLSTGQLSPEWLPSLYTATYLCLLAAALLLALDTWLWCYKSRRSKRM